jgi:hypothetical protein
VSQWWGGWRPPALGEPALAPGAVPGLGGLGVALFGSVGAARRLLLLAPLVLGPIGAWRLFGPARSLQARTGALLAYALSPIALNAMGEARLQALLAWAVAPWLLRRIARQAGIEPLAMDPAERVGTLRHVAGNALLIGLVVALSPLAAVVAVAAVALVVLGTALSGQGREGRRGLLALFGGLVGAASVNGVWIAEAVRRGDAATLTGMFVGRGALPSAAEMLTGSIGPILTGLLGWGTVVAAAVPLFTGRQWRLGWAVGGWLSVLGGLAAAVIAARAGWTAGAGVALLLVPVALGLCVGVAMAPLAFRSDVVRADFGAPQLLSVIGVAGLVLGALPVLVAATQGRWYLPEGDFDRSLGLVDGDDDFRALWIGDPDVLPVAGWAQPGVEGMAVGLSEGLSPEMPLRWRLDGGAPVEAVHDGLGDALQGRTSHFGAQLARMSVRYVVVVDRPAPEPFVEREVRAPEGVVESLQEQLDLSLVPVGEGVTLFQVTAPWPARADATDVDPTAGPTDGEAPPAVLGRGFGTAFSGELEPDRTVAQSVTADPGWDLVVDGDTARREDRPFGVQAFVSGAGGEAELAWSTPWTTRLLQGLQVLALALLVLAAVRSQVAMPPPPARRVRSVGAAEPLVRVGPPPADVATADAAAARPAADGDDGHGGGS